MGSFTPKGMAERVRWSRVGAGIFAAVAAAGSGCLDANPKFEEPPQPTATGSQSGTTADGPTSEPGGPTTADTTGSTSNSAVTGTSADTEWPTTSSTTGPETTTDMAAQCGDGVMEGGEECDNGADNSDEAECTATCKLAKCGDGLVQQGAEGCDDGNTEPDDGCVQCVVPVTCRHILVLEPGVPSGVYRVDPDEGGPMQTIPVYCDMELDMGGWTLVERSPFDDPIGRALWAEEPWNMGDPTNDKFRMPRKAMEAIRDHSDEMWLDCEGDDHLRTSKDSLFAGEFLPVPTCSKAEPIVYTEASFKGHVLMNVELCTLFTGTNDGECAGAWSIDEWEQYQLCTLDDFPWWDEAVTPMSADAFAADPRDPDGGHECHMMGAARRILLR